MTLSNLSKYGLVALAMAASAPALADQDLSYSFIEAQYIDTEFDDVDINGDGLALSGSVAVGDRFFLNAGFSSLDFDEGVDLEQRTIGLGVNAPITERTDLVATVAYVDAELDTDFGSADTDGYSVGVGVRSMVLDGLELNAGVNYIDLDQGGDDTSFNFGSRYYFTDNLSLGAGVQIGDDVTTWTGGIRLDF